MNYLLLIFTLIIANTAALVPPVQTPKTEKVQTIVDRRNAVFGLSSAAAAGLVTLFPKPSLAAGDASVFVGTYSDPNHPGGTRTVRLLDTKVGDYQLAEVAGGGGRGEPASYVLPAVVIGDRTIIIDFSPKGGPRDFAGALDGNGIKFFRDGNKWPRVS
uniref:Uncharacterized protein n=1 Tax=Helicotheca tamesis TaxID=374047 RepID=A0A7S2MMX9_9STRA|mmetsp:Transcript_18667/g.25732  ORF Transcript_18667/g.25732 Transcript_18667/m.25732 type:complete len:159 (+) Transcript_18667:28-504(+)|eukprot:CAMPEP_0185730330 /NCGR_PEP_ID=MMETSP1171-20130828/9501_1 /TAXON_ID=374046 /ORGANISM="Helicotheca tamensis, Strain CCMP826" /LENGTH=158 /DNA_ID=CAMNT_0028399353 /DNA_START=89 /DNA_END=565 /DNA_ORIENTATION=-